MSAQSAATCINHTVLKTQLAQWLQVKSFKGVVDCDFTFLTLVSVCYVMMFVSYCVFHNICILLDVFFLSFRSPLICYVLPPISGNWEISWRFPLKRLFHSSEGSWCDFGPVALLQASYWSPDQNVFSVLLSVSFDRWFSL